ncbi:beta-ketoacyl-ACP synthase II [Desulforudis sp. 1088]|uniref:beta-ketoacyl-ACP synthase II n=1 Tax=unclassified Candidatus Desulforudis TaxID=2635950 RepID=UPI003CE524AB
MRVRTVITGLGVISPLGLGVKTFWEALVAGKSGIRRITQFDASSFRTRIAGEVPDFDPVQFIDKKEARRMDRYTQFAVAATGLAIEDAGLELDGLQRDRVGVILGSGIGGMRTLEEQARILFERGPDRVSPLFVPMMIGNMAAAQIALTYRLCGPNATVVTACASSNNAIGDACQILRRGEADVMITGGTEAAITPLALAGFCAMKALSTRNDEPERASRPFDAERDGFVMAEGSAVLVVETEEHALKRGARIYAEICGYGSTCDAYHITAPDPEGTGAAYSMVKAMTDAGITPDEVDYINAHGTSTPLGDVAEVKAIKRALGPAATKVAVSSSKSMTGHLLGAAGGIEAAACALAIAHEVIPPTINYEQPDPECDLDFVPNKARKAKVRVALSNAFGFGGHNATLALRRYEGR